MENPKVVISKRAARFLNDGDVVNLGIGMPEMVANYLPEGVNIVFQSENGIMGMGPAATAENEDTDVSNAGGKYVTLIPGAMVFDSATSFGLIRGGHVDATILGALQVDEEGSLSSHIIPGKLVPGMGGAMDLVSGAENVIVIIHPHRQERQCQDPQEEHPAPDRLQARQVDHHRAGRYRVHARGSRSARGQR